MTLVETLRFITSHPLNAGRPMRAIAHYLGWQLRSHMSSEPSIVPFVNQSVLAVRRGMTGLTGNVYCGLHEYEEMAFVLHLLRPRDLFVDVGANAGSYSILAGVAAGADVIAVEPVPHSASALRRNVALNAAEARIVVEGVALGEQACRVHVTTHGDAENHVVAAAGNEPPTTEVEQTTLDALVARREPIAIKIDVEGYEASVLAGAQDCLRRESLKALMIEISLGGHEHQIREQLRGLGFHICRYDAERRRLELDEARTSGGNTLMVRDLGWARARLQEAARFRVHQVGREV